MKSAFKFCIFFLLATVAAFSDAQTANVPPPTAYSIASRGPSSRLWQRTFYEPLPSGQTTTITQSYTELSDSLCFFRSGAWHDSDDTISVLPDGSACSTNCPCSCYFPIDLGNGVVTLVSSEGVQVKLRPEILCYDDESNTVVLATLTNSVGQQIGVNQVIYTNALAGSVNADVLYTWRKGGFEQDIILHQQPASADSMGLNGQNVKMEVLSEFIDSPQPTVTKINIPTPTGEATDENPAFGSIRMIPGKAFLLGAGEEGVSVLKSMVQVNGRQFLAESVPLSAIANDLAQLPRSAARTPSRSKRRSMLAAVPVHHKFTEKSSGKKILISKAGPPRTGFRIDFATVNGGLTNQVFGGDGTFYVSAGGITLYGTNTFEGGAVFKFTNGASISILPSDIPDGLIWKSQSGLPVTLTAQDDNSIGEEISGSTGNPNGSYYANPALHLVFTNPTAQSVSNFRIAYAQQAVSLTGDDAPGFFDGQLVDCQNGFNADGTLGVALENVLFANVQTDFDNLFSGGFSAENCTFSSATNLATIESADSADALCFTNCIFAGVFNLTNNYSDASFSLAGGNNGFYNAPTFGSTIFTTSTDPFTICGGGSYYLTNACAFRGVGTTNIDPALLADLAAKTTWPPIVYDETNISSLGTLGPTVPRDISSTPDLGAHYCPIDAVFGGCFSSNSITIAAGTSIGIFGDSTSGWPYGIELDNGGSLNFEGNATQPCILAFADMVQEGGNGAWTAGEGGAFQGGIIWNGTSTGPEPLVSANFTKWIPDNYRGLWDGSGYGGGSFKNCEFYIGNASTSDMQYLIFTNCLFFRNFLVFWDNSYALNFTFENCTYFNGCLAFARYNSNPNISSSFWLIENCTFDGTAFHWADSLNANPANTFFNYNAYNTNNLSWVNYPNISPTYGTNEIVGPNDVLTTNYNWQASWFGDFYLPPPGDSPLIEAGSTNSEFLGLYHFTTQTNANSFEGDSTVDIGYHYLGTDQYGNPIDSNADGIPDYIEDANGNGSGNWDTTMFLNVVITQPRNGSTLP